MRFFQKSWTITAIIAAIISLVASMGSSLQAAMSYREVMAFSDEAPGTGHTWYKINNPAISSSGGVSLSGEINSLSAYDTGAWSEVDGEMTLIAKEGDVDFKQHIAAICEVVQGPVSAEVTSTDTEGMVREGRDYARIAAKRKAERVVAVENRIVIVSALKILE